MTGSPFGDRFMLGIDGAYEDAAFWSSHRVSAMASYRFH